MTGLRVLFATDGSPGAEDALGLLIASFDPGRVERIEVLSVVPRATRWRAPGREEHGPISIIESAHRAAAEAVVRDAGTRLGAAGFRTTEAVVGGHPAETIVVRAEAEPPDLVIVGTRGLGELRRQIVGSVSAKTARYAPTSVLVARTADPIRRVVLGYDASPDADLALDLVSSLPFREAVSVTVCTIYEVTVPLAAGIAPTMIDLVRAAHHEDLREAREAAIAVAADAARRLSERGLNAGPRASHGTPSDQLMVAAGELAADLVVVGSRGLARIKQFPLGSTSAALVGHPPASVLVARGKLES